MTETSDQRARLRSRRPTQRPLRSDAERNRQRILSAAGEVFADRGLGATMDEIAGRAGVGVGTVYRRYPDKELLIDALFEDRIEELARVGEQALAAEDPWRGLMDYLEAAVAQQAADRGLRDLLLSTAYGHDRVARARERLGPITAQLVERAQKDGELRSDLAANDVPLLYLMLGAIVDYTRDIEPAAWRRFFVLVADGLRSRRTEPDELPTGALEDDQVDEAMSRRPPWRAERPGA
jgi:AcrR family transcriptional regulator